MGEMDDDRDEKGRFKDGWKGGPGRPKGTSARSIWNEIANEEGCEEEARERFRQEIRLVIQEKPLWAYINVYGVEQADIVLRHELGDELYDLLKARYASTGTEKEGQAETQNRKTKGKAK